MKIFTFGDGFATGHIWPEWPQILAALFPEHTIINQAAVGAGPEYLVTCFVDCLPQIDNNKIIFQWPKADRFDKLLEDNSWSDVINNDDTYSFNTVKDQSQRLWWISSASASIAVRHYHEFYVQSQQHQLRLDIWKSLIENVLKHSQCQWIFTSTEDQDLFSKKLCYKNIRGDQIQPSPIIHFDWLVNFVLPKLSLTPHIQRQEILRQKIAAHHWQAFDPDRYQIWQDILSALDG